jgi:hypothetical protein
MNTGTINALINVAHNFFPEMLAAGQSLHKRSLAWKDCHYAILCVGPADYDIEFAIQVGETRQSQGRRDADHYVALKQAGALNRKIEKGIVASSQLNTTGGAVVLPYEGVETIFSVRGFPSPHENEAFAMLLAEIARPTDRLIAERCRAIAATTRNKQYRAIQKALEV